jgi:hypothetical protein
MLRCSHLCGYGDADIVTLDLWSYHLSEAGPVVSTAGERWERDSR